MAKARDLKKEIPAKKDLVFEKKMMEEIKTFQDAYQKRYKDQIEQSNKMALERYTVRLESLKKRKSELLKEYNEEIKKYQALVKDLTPPAKKTPTKAAPRKKKETKTLPPKK